MFICRILRIVVFWAFVEICSFNGILYDNIVEALIYNDNKFKNNQIFVSNVNKKQKNKIYTSRNTYSFIHSYNNNEYFNQNKVICPKYNIKRDYGNINVFSLDGEEQKVDIVNEFDLDDWNDYELIDYCKIKVGGGNGGNGCLSFRREKHVPLGGANGGNGGPGGSVFIECDSKISDLRWFEPNKFYKADNGGNGMGCNRNGAKGKDMYLLVPPGTTVCGENEEIYANLVQNGDKIKIARGGRGGKGNRHYITRFNTAPRICEKGEVGTSRDIKLIYKKSSDIGLIGKPNSGKSSIIKALTNAKPRVANYPFCTRFPIYGTMEFEDKNETNVDDNKNENNRDNRDNRDNMPIIDNFDEYDYDEDEFYGSSDEEYLEEPLFEQDDEMNENEFYGDENHTDSEYESYIRTNTNNNNNNIEYENNSNNNNNEVNSNKLIIADIPGLIDGSSQGKGLGHKFLRHVERCQIVSYVLDSSLEDPLGDYLDVKNELEMYDSNLIKKPEIILLNKIDLIDNKKMLELIDMFIKACDHDRIFFLSAKTRENIEVINKLFAKIHSENIFKNKNIKITPINDEIEEDNFRRLNPKSFRVEKEYDGIFRILSPYLERKVKMMRFELPETVEKLRNILIVNKIKKRLVKLGLKEGDTVNIGELAFKVQSEDFLM